jgi:hypothetical protein
MAEDGFFSRWSRRKTQVARGEQPREAPPETKDAVRAEPVEAPRPGQAASPSPSSGRTESTSPGRTQTVPAAPVEPPPTLEDVARLDRDSDYARFVARDVAPEVKNAALRKLFSDPHFNVMDGLDIYIDDYGKPDPIPPGMLRQLAQSKLLGLFDDEDKPQNPNTAAGTPDGPAAPAAAAPAAGAAPPVVPADDPAAPPPLTSPASDEDPHLQLQPHHAAGRSGAGEGPAAGAGAADGS